MRKTAKSNLDDLQCLAFEWEDLLSEISYPSKKLALRVLWGLAAAYIRGQGKRRVKAAGSNKYGIEMVSLQTQVFEYIEQHRARDIHFPRVTALGFDSIEHTNEILIAMSARGKEKAD